MRVKGNEVEYYFDFLLAQPQTLQNNEFTLMTYDSTYYVAMRYAEIGKRAVDFSALPVNCKGRCSNLMSMKKLNPTLHHWINLKK